MKLLSDYSKVIFLLFIFFHFSSLNFLHIRRRFIKYRPRNEIDVRNKDPLERGQKKSPERARAAAAEEEEEKEEVEEDKRCAPSQPAGWRGERATRGREGRRRRRKAWRERECV